MTRRCEITFTVNTCVVPSNIKGKKINSHSLKNSMYKVQGSIRKKPKFHCSQFTENFCSMYSYGKKVNNMLSNGMGVVLLVVVIQFGFIDLCSLIWKLHTV